MSKIEDGLYIDVKNDILVKVIGFVTKSFSTDSVEKAGPFVVCMNEEHKCELWEVDGFNENFEFVQRAVTHPIPLRNRMPENWVSNRK